MVKLVSTEIPSGSGLLHDLFKLVFHKTPGCGFFHSCQEVLFWLISQLELRGGFALIVFFVSNLRLGL